MWFVAQAQFSLSQKLMIPRGREQEEEGEVLNGKRLLLSNFSPFVPPLVVWALERRRRHLWGHLK